ncbi:hypothetical protein RJ639_014501, partial [Escallonia herrerae]
MGSSSTDTFSTICREWSGGITLVFLGANDSIFIAYLLSLSGLLNFMDGLWSCCGDEKIIVFTTNNKEKLDPALLRPGRIDMHIHMSYLCLKTPTRDDHPLFGVRVELIKSTKVSPAAVAEEHITGNGADVCLGGLVSFLKRKKMESIDSNIELNQGKEAEIEPPKIRRERREDKERK